MNSKNNPGFWEQAGHFFLYNLLFALLQIAYILSRGSNFLQAIPLPLNVHIEIIMTGVIQLGLYGLLSILQATLFWGIAWPGMNREAQFRWQIILFTLTVVWLLAINCYLFPLSAFSRLLLPAIPMPLIRVILGLSSLCLAILTILALWKGLRRTPYRFAAGMILFLSLTLLFLPHHTTSNTPSRETRYPNIILIGIDSLNPERINASQTPTINQFLKQSVQFKETISPLARTYPAWTTILTGLYPLHTGARENLVPKTRVNDSDSIVRTLRNLGYYTIFATDDRRFNNLGKEFGFQEILGPKTGIDDTLLGTYNDFPLSNLLINFRISAWLFPYNYLNRASHYSYYPATFDKALQRMLQRNRHNRPMMLAVHFALPHWPYAWAKSHPAEVGNEYSIAERSALYHAAVHRADQQIGILLARLREEGLLTNSLVILLSDHGEALYEEKSRLTRLKNHHGQKPSRLAGYFRRKTATTLEKSAGHGSDLLSPAQFRCLLGFKIISKDHLVTKPRLIQSRVALIDIAPTIYSFLHLPIPPAVDGISLFNALLGKSRSVNHRAIMMESGMLPNQFISQKKAIRYGQLLFRVNPENNYLELKPNQLQAINDMKLYGLIQDDWLLALYPDDEQYIPVIVRLSDKQWTDDPASEFASHSPFKTMLQQLRHFFRQDLADYPKTRPNPLLP
ncbi:sulfatase-like hydrolase/transferase [Legionella spiritensis]|uniref:Putative Sulfatase n=1 Tax=Legionella spiritensis TaxID=452 RepID=A0A0W0Z048_LEGSP|nr:sulfatase-like hydrolase/transferase [Legionella spiritensis]KTD62516.1 putative Sulfatase [Legionella spiritensis]SNV30865.1 putative Sulfatase [Legionella spiritensis]